MSNKFNQKDGYLTDEANTIKALVESKLSSNKEQVVSQKSGEDSFKVYEESHSLPTGGKEHDLYAAVDSRELYIKKSTEITNPGQRCGEIHTTTRQANLNTLEENEEVNFNIDGKNQRMPLPKGTTELSVQHDYNTLLLSDLPDQGDSINLTLGNTEYRMKNGEAVIAKGENKGNNINVKDFKNKVDKMLEDAGMSDLKDEVNNAFASQGHNIPNMAQSTDSKGTGGWSR